MKEVIMDLGKEIGGGLGQNHPSQLTTNKDIVTRCKHLCVVCALRKHDLRKGRRNRMLMHVTLCLLQKRG